MNDEEVMSVGTQRACRNFVQNSNTAISFHNAIIVVSYPVFMPQPSTHRMHDPGSNVPYIRPKVLTDNQMS
jgi:hypothetical protein